MSELLTTAKALNDNIVQLRRGIHQNAEVGLHLPHTKELVLKELERLGIKGESCGDSGVVACIQGDKPGKTFLLRADMDALPMGEETGLEFACSNGNMHACGHDCHTAMLLGAAALLVENRDKIQGTVKLLFQPGEEIMEGAKEMVDSGVLANPTVDAAMMIHIVSAFPTPSGVVGVFGGGPSYSSVDWFRIDINGKGAHGATPYLGVSPLTIMAAISNQLQEIISLGIPSSENAVLTVGEMHGGNIANIIPDTAYMTGTIRTFSNTVRKTIKDKMELGIPLVAQSRGGNATVSFGANAPCVNGDAAVSASVLGSGQALLGEQMALNMSTIEGGAYARVSGSEDFAYIAEKVPSAVALLVAGSIQDGYTHPAHHPKADFDESVLYVGSAFYAQSALDWLQNNA